MNNNKTMIDTSLLQKKIREALGSVLQSNVPKYVGKVLKEAVILTPRTFVMKGETQSPTTKETHEKFYKSLVDSFNKISARLDTATRTEDNKNDSEFRRLKLDESHNLSGVKLHELYFTNIGDLHSEVRADSTPFMRLSRDWGTFDQWQLDFRACGMVAREGWAICYFEPFKQQYLNCFIEENSCCIPLLGIPVLVIDCHHHAWFYDFPGEKLEYLNKSMREINWNVVEVRMLAAEMAKLNQIYAVQPVLSSEKSPAVALPQSLPPVEVIPSGGDYGGGNI